MKTHHRFVAIFILALPMSLAAPADAARGPAKGTSKRTAKPNKARQAKPRAAKRPATVASRLQSKLTLGKRSRRNEVTDAHKELLREAHQGTAAAMYVIPKQGVRETVIRNQGDYGSGQSLEVSVSGLGAGGTYDADFVGSVSTHDVGNREINQFIKDRVSKDGVKLIHIKPDGSRTELVANHPSEIVTHLNVSLKLGKGKNVLMYERTDRASGRTVSMRNLYPEWRQKVINWDGN